MSEYVQKSICRESGCNGLGLQCELNFMMIYDYIEWLENALISRKFCDPPPNDCFDTTMGCVLFGRHIVNL